MRLDLLIGDRQFMSSMMIKRYHVPTRQQMWLCGLMGHQCPIAGLRMPVKTWMS